jgi:hypothetical protein
MLNLIPAPKKIQYQNGFLKVKAIAPFNGQLDERLLAQLNKLPTAENGCEISFEIGQSSSENYSLEIIQNGIKILADGIRGGFYALQTLRQIFTHESVPCLTIQDTPSFGYRGFYHDLTRGKIPTVDTLKTLIDDIAYLKYNSLQLYVEHVYEFTQTEEIVKKTGYITKAELQELDEYCKQNFIDFIPSLSTFGHMYEILCQEQFSHLAVENQITEPNEWANRQMHHTIDPTNPQSIELIKSLIDQYSQAFTSDYFNICCDETFDLKKRYGEKEKELYIDFVKKIIAHVKSKGKKVMMWADILLAYPETIEYLPQDTIFLNWDYRAQPELENVEKLAKLGKTQIVCPGTWSWNNFIENLLVGEPNICKMAEYGISNDAKGMLVTNWGDYNNICSLENSRYGLFLGGEKCWNPTAVIDQEFYKKVNHLAFSFDKAMDYYMQVVNLQKDVSWADFCYMYSRITKGLEYNKQADYSIEFIAEKQAVALDLMDKLSKEKWENGDYKRQLINAIQGICLMVESNAKLTKTPIKQLINVKDWLKEYSDLWLKYNKPSELHRVVELFENIYKM